MLVLMPACMDCFAAGALLAYLHYRGKENNQWMKWVSFIAIPVWLLLILTNHHRTFIGLDRVFISLFTVTVIDIANRGYTGISEEIFGKPNCAISLQNQLWNLSLSSDRYFVFLENI